jgi:hypothetical protein
MRTNKLNSLNIRFLLRQKDYAILLLYLEKKGTSSAMGDEQHANILI